MWNGHVKEVASLMEGDWFCYKGGLFNGGGMVMEVGSFMGEEWSCYGGGQFNGGIMIMPSVLWREWSLRRSPV